jgi:hypothetical protein
MFEQFQWIFWVIFSDGKWLVDGFSQSIHYIKIKESKRLKLEQKWDVKNDTHSPY